MRATVCAMSSTARWMIFELRARRDRQVRLAFEQRFGVQRHGRNGVVDVVRDAAGHLAERAQAFLLHDLLLRGAQVVVGLLQGGVQLRLVRGQRGVFHGLAQEFALAAAEGVARCAARATRTPNTWLSTSSGAMTSERMPALASLVGNGNCDSAMSGS